MEAFHRAIESSLIFFGPFLLGLGKRLLGTEPAALAKVLEGMFEHAGSSTQQAGQTAIIINLCRH